MRKKVFKQSANSEKFIFFCFIVCVRTISTVEFVYNDFVLIYNVTFFWSGRISIFLSTIKFAYNGIAYNVNLGITAPFICSLDKFCLFITALQVSALNSATLPQSIIIFKCSYESCMCVFPNLLYYVTRSRRST